MMQTATGEKAVMWGPAIVGFGSHLIPYADGRVAPWPVMAFSPRKSAFVLYVGRKHADLVKKVGKHKMAGGCLHIKALSDVDEAALQRLIAAVVRSRKSGCGSRTRGTRKAGDS